MASNLIAMASKLTATMVQAHSAFLWASHFSGLQVDRTLLPQDDRPDSEGQQVTVKRSSSSFQ